MVAKNYILEFSEGALLDIEAIDSQIIEDAKEVSAEFESEWLEENNKHDYVDYGSLCIRVRRKDGTFYATWQKFWFVGPKGKRKKLSSDIPKGRGSKYTVDRIHGNQFKDWEIDLFKKYEPRFAHFREQARSLGTVRRTVKKNLLKKPRKIEED